ncbi:hypothetical protein KBX50_20370 [Micromonospora sp. C51]|uniref:AfsR/SARP family transcriptional regulator n=1 Tax=Micromonospora sp. C51 TaxID=2824879 RepID=UPI001B39286E|nr:hypothetical protein [Micromonospora sp. C51]MBQ1050816.1 hypothetical protein [Micromonospora sp. C51]
MRWPQRIAALLLTTVLLAGPPILLVRLVGWPTTDPPRVALWQWVHDPLTEQNLTLMLVVAAWLLWAFIAYLVTATTATRLWAGVRWLRHLPLPTPWQATATGIAGAAALTIAAPTTPVDDQGATTSTTTNTEHDNAKQADTADGITVRGGWLPHDIADQVTAAAGLIWLRRRRAYRPTRPRRYAENADDLAALPATVAAVQSATVSRPSPPSPVPTAAALPLFGFPPTGVGLVGPGALNAARGLLITALLATARQTTVELVITRRAVDMLLGPAALRLRPGTGLRVADNLAHAAALLAAPGTASVLSGPAGDGRPPVLILDEPPPGSLANILTIGVMTVTVLGAWPHGTTWHVEADGHTHASKENTGLRVCVLDPVATADLLTVTGHLHPPAPATPTHPRPRAQAPRQTAPQHDTIRPGKRLLVRVLGEPTLLIDGTAMAVRRTAAQQALVFLAVHPDGVDSHLMAEALWPGLPGHRLTGRLYTTLSELRTAVRDTTGISMIDRTSDRYRLHPDHVDVDLWHLHAAVDHAASALTDPTTAWHTVIDTYTGDLAAGYLWPWLIPHRETARRHVLDAYAALAATEPDSKQALAYLQGGIRIDPYNADLHQRAARILNDIGEHTAATSLTDRYTRRLATAGLTHENTHMSGHA